MYAFEIRCRIFLFEYLAFNPFEIDLHLVGNATVDQSFFKRFIGVEQARIFANHRNRHFTFRLGDAGHDISPDCKIGRLWTCETKDFQNFLVQPFSMIGPRHIIDRRHIQCLDDRGGAHIAEQRNLAALVLWNFPISTAKNNVGLNADGAQFLDRMLGGLGLQFPGSWNIGQQRQVDVKATAPWRFLAKLADRLKKRQAFNVTHRATDFHQHKIMVIIAGADEIHDRIRHMGNDLHSCPQKITAPFLGDDVLVNPPRCDVVLLVGMTSGEAFVMAQIKIGFRAIIGHKNLAVLIGAHGARIDVEIGIKLPQTDLVSPRLQQGPKGCRCEAFSEGRNHAACNENVTRHGRSQ